MSYGMCPSVPVLNF